MALSKEALDSLKNWTTFNEHLLEWSIKDLKLMLAHERKYGKRKTFIDRIIKRLSKTAANKVKDDEA